MKYVNITKDKQLSYISEGEGEVLVFIHSFLWDKEMWRPQIDILKNNYRCISIDLLGHGNSSNISTTNEVYSLEEISEDVIGVLDELGVESYHYIGLSVGGMLAPYISQDKRAKSMIIMDSFVGEEPLETLKGYFEILKTIKELQYIPKPMVDIIAPMFFSIKTVEDKTDLYSNFHNHLSNLCMEKVDSIVAMGFGIFGRSNNLKKLESITIPTLYLSGEFDIPRPKEESEKMSSLTKNSQFKIVRGAGHISNLENSDSVTNYIVDFLETV